MKILEWTFHQLLFNFSPGTPPHLGLNWAYHEHIFNQLDMN
ncbi:hypothetical protein GGD38_001382 [Chitinophagaceae bacterium OAS944]|nr:hypothetical protein [Chitinophagaceae bacterium OAS944]